MPLESIKKITKASEDRYHQEIPFAKIPRGSYDHYVYLELSALRDGFDETMAKSMMEVEWPEGMSAVEQMRVMFSAAIEAVIGPDKE